MTIVVSDDPRVTPLVRELINKAKANNGTLTIATHDGKFHADECLCIAMLKHKLRDLWSGDNELEFKIVRTRNEDKINAADIAVDVGGGTYDHHHQVDRYPNGVPYASCGKILEAIESDKKVINLLLNKSLYAVQAIDNGECDMRHPTNYFAWVRVMNETYKECTESDCEEELFTMTLEMVETVYRRLYLAVIDQIESCKQLKDLKMYCANRILELPSGRSMAWKYLIKRSSKLCGVIYPHNKDTGWTLKWMSDPPGAIMETFRVEFPLEWRSEIRAINGNTQIASMKYTLGCKFCHPSGYLATFESKEHALAAAEYVLALDRSVYV